jgi:cellulose synthase/poly-beta-1,6-N-acetylglucosamine synthase-like glycosyltransferase
VSAILLLDVALVATALPVALASAYLLVLAALSRRPRAPHYHPPHLRFDLIVPAHDEEGGIGATIASLSAVDYPAPLRRIVVEADNCGDATAARAREAGAHVLVRDDPDRRGKGYALAHAFAWSLADGFADAVVVVDADTVVSPNLLRAFQARLDAGAAAVQSHYGVRNPDASWRTRLMTIAFALFHEVRSIARERLACSAGLHGNGMCFAVSLLREVPHQAFSVVEDLEYGIRLGLAGHRVHHAAEATVLGEMVSSGRDSRSQRRRWEGGRLRMLRAHAGPLLRLAIARRDRVLLDLAADLLVPPLALLGGAAAAGGAVAVLVASLADRPMGAPWLFGGSLLALAAYVARGWWLSGTGLQGLWSLLRAPLYLAWKVGVALARPDHPSGVWVRTARERGSASVAPE